MQQPSIQVRNLRKGFFKRTGFRKKSELLAVNDVSFHVMPGETYGLLGPNGSGKSSLIRILSTLLIADSGYVRLLDFPLPDQAEEVRRIIGRVSVDAAFYKKLSARENLLYTALLYGQKMREAETRVMDILDQLGMEYTKFSTPLPAVSLRDVQSFLKDPQARVATTILLTTHDMAEAERLCARIGFLSHGKLVAEGTARQLMQRAGDRKSVV